MLGFTWVLGVLSQALSHIKLALPLLNHFPHLSFTFSLKFYSVYLLIPSYFQLYFPFPKCCFDLFCCLNFLLNWISFQKSFVLRPDVFSSGWTLGFSPGQELPVCISPLFLSRQLTVPSLSVCCFCGWFLFLSVTSAVFLCDCVPVICDLSCVPLWLCSYDLTVVVQSFAQSLINVYKTSFLNYKF